MNQSEGCLVPREENKACKSIKSLYSLKKATKEWHEKLILF